jgi:hypothetical protein
VRRRVAREGNAGESFFSLTLRPRVGKIDPARFAVHRPLDTGVERVGPHTPVTDALRKIVCGILEDHFVRGFRGDGEARFGLVRRLGDVSQPLGQVANLNELVLDGLAA